MHLHFIGPLKEIIDYDFLIERVRLFQILGAAQEKYIWNTERVT